MSQNFLSRWWKNISIEPVILCYYLCSEVNHPLLTNLFLQKSCRWNATSEPNLDTPCDDEKAGILYTASINSWSLLTSQLLAMILPIFAASWSDEAGKRRLPLFILPVIGAILQYTVGLLQSYFWQWDPLSAIYAILVINLFCGSKHFFGIAVFTYVSDTTTYEDRTFKMGIYHAIQTLAKPISSGSVGFMMRYLGFFYTYLLWLTVSVLTLILTLVMVKENPEARTTKTTMLNTINPARIVKTVKTIFRKRPENRRLVIVILLLTDALAYFTYQGEQRILYLYTRNRFKWNERDFSVFITLKIIGIVVVVCYQMVTGMGICLIFLFKPVPPVPLVNNIVFEVQEAAGTMLAMTILSKHYKIHDGIIGALAAFWDTMAAVCNFFATQAWQLYAIICLDIFHGTANVISRALISKIIDDDEYGQLASVRALIEIVLPFNHLVYNTVLKYTLNSFSNAIFLISIALDIPIVIMYSCSYCLTKNMQQPMKNTGSIKPAEEITLM